MERGFAGDCQVASFALERLRHVIHVEDPNLPHLSLPTITEDY
jgi:hypothetical protein